MKAVIGHGLRRIDEYRTRDVPIFFDDRHRIIVAPTRWIMSIAKLRSRSDETLRKYSAIIVRYLRWLDDQGYGSQNWAAVDFEIFDEYLKYVALPFDGLEFGPLQETVRDYGSRIVGFYDWAQRHGHNHFLDVDREEVEFRLQDQFLLGHISDSIGRTKLGFDLPNGAPAYHEIEMEKFLGQEDYLSALQLLDDIVFRVIAAVMRITAMRPKEVLQLPYRGKGENAGFEPYDELPEGLDLGRINFACRSKGKNRRIAFPGRLWRVICEQYIPLRRERAKLFAARNGISPPNSVLFLTAEGYPVNYSILHHHFSKVVQRSNANVAEGEGPVYRRRKFTARMLRHTCATYFVFEALKKNNMLGRSYVYDAAVDEDLRLLLGHEDVGTSYKYYVHLANRFFQEDLLADLHKKRVDAGLSSFLEAQDYWGDGARG